jgi:1-acyl-sn-glycerol-3-phosphate acyltransferase
MLKHNVPKQFQGNRTKVFQKCSSLVLSAAGWSVKGQIPNECRLIITAAPHTSNWDFVLAMLCIISLNIKVRWLGKSSIFKPGFKWFFHWLGGIPVNRDNPASLIDDVATIVKNDNGIIICVTPEGSRKKVTRWKTGFLRIAELTDSKILLVSINAPTRTVHIGKIFKPSGDKDKDVLAVKSYYKPFQGINPENS